jgi:hypothetical protein
MNELIIKLQEVVREIEKEQGKSFLLSGVVEPESNFGKLDLVLSAEWIDNSNYQFLRYASQKVVEKLSRPDFSNFGSVVILDPKAAVGSYGADTAQHPYAGYRRDYRFGDIDIKFAQIFAPQSGQRSYAN